MNTAILDVAIGLMFIYLLCALVCSVLQELLANLLKSRARNLKEAIQLMLNDPNMSGLASSLYAHPRIAAFSDGGRLPSYINAKAFAEALVDVLGQAGHLHVQIDGPLAPFLRRADGDLETLRADLAGWFDQSMDRLSGYYKRKTQTVLLVLGLIVAALLNVNSLQVAQTLWSTPAVSKALVDHASRYMATHDNAQPPEKAELEAQFRKLATPIGWAHTSLPPFACTQAALLDWLVLLAGWMITALATCLGTQFWFNTLQTALQLRGTGKKPESAATETASGKG